MLGAIESGAYNDSWINQTFFNKTQILAFGYYNSSNFVITDYFTKTDVLNLGYFNSTTLQNLSQLNDNLGNRGYTHLSNFTNDLGVGNYNDSWINQTFFNKTEILAFNYYNASDFDIGDYFTKLEISGFGYYNSSDFDINDYYTKSVVYNKSEVYNISEIDSIIPDLDNYFTKSEISGFAYYNDTNFPYTHLSNFSNDLEFLTEESDPIFIAENSTLWSAINSKLATSDQRYNETTLILSLNTTSNIMSLGFYNSTEIDDLIQGVGNLSFNQSLTDTLYASIVWGYNQTQPAIDYVDAQGFITDGIENNTAGWILNFTSIRSNDWSNVSLSEAQIIDFGEYIDESTANAIYLNLSGTNANQNLNIGEYNLTTTGTGFFGFLGSLASRVTKLWVGEINATGNIETSGNVSANYFIGDGSLLNNLPVGDETDPVWAADKPNYYTQTQSNATYVKKEGDTLSGNLNLSSNNITAVDCIVFASGGKICSAS